ncbi:MST2-like protein [Camelus ferus]|nr:MST2-like protein [Camelus ferus]
MKSPQSQSSASASMSALVLKNLSLEELQMRLKALDPMMEREIEELRQRYTAKRQPILDAMDAKKRRQQNF